MLWNVESDKYTIATEMREMKERKKLLELNIGELTADCIGRKVVYS
jgi:hypothetical protein